MECKEYKGIGERIYQETLPNGLSIYVVPKAGHYHSHAMFATNYGGSDMRFCYNGQWKDTPAGIAHFLEHKMFDMEDGNALNILSANGASPNAFTSNNMTAYYFDSTQGFDENLRMLLTFVSTPYFTEDTVEKERGIIGQEIRMTEDNPNFAVYENLMRALYKYNPIRTSVAGTVESIQEITAETLYACHKVFYNPSNMVLCVTGDVDPKAVVSAAREILPDAPGEPPQRDYGQAEGPEPAERRIAAAMEVMTPLFLAGAKVLQADAGEAAYKLSLVGDLSLQLLMGDASPLYRRLYEAGLVNGKLDTECDLVPGGGCLVFGGSSRDPDAVLEEVQAEAARLVRDGVPAEPFDRLKKAKIGRWLRDLDDFAGVCVNQVEGHFRGYTPFATPDLLEQITREEVQAFLGEYMTRDRLALSLVEPIGGAHKE